MYINGKNLAKLGVDFFILQKKIKLSTLTRVKIIFYERLNFPTCCTYIPT